MNSLSESDLKKSIQSYKNQQKNDTGFSTAIQEMKNHVDTQRMKLGKDVIPLHRLKELSYDVLSGKLSINDVINS